MNTTFKNLLLCGFISSVSFSLSCGSNPNLFKTAETRDPAEEAARELELGDPAKAIDIIIKELGDNAALAVENTDMATLKTQLALATADRGDAPKLLSLLSAGYSQLHGIDPLTFALKFASSSSSGSSGNAMTALFPFLPEASAYNVQGIDRALAILQSIPLAAFTKADSYKEAMLLTCSLSIHSKALDKNGDGIISADEVISLGSSDAQSILSNLASAAASIAAATGGDEKKAAEVAAKVQSLQTAIAAESGANDEEKLKNYLSKNPNAASAAQASSTATSTLSN